MRITQKIVSTISSIRDSVWDIIGSKDVYDSNVTYTKIKKLQKFMKAERDFLDDIILDNDNPNDIVLIEIGSGTGRLLLQYLDVDVNIKLQKEQALTWARKLTRGKLKKLINKVTYIIAIDKSKEMNNCFRNNLKKYNIRPSNLLILEEDASEIDIYLPKILRDLNLTHHTKVFCCMLNTLGNMQSEERIKVLKAVKNVMNYDDIFIITTWNRSSFKEGIEMYKKLTDVIGEFDKNDINYSDATLITKINYYTHWFSEKELDLLLKSIGFKSIKFHSHSSNDFILAQVKL